ncbi:MAG: phosphatidate phosphatase App1 family protein [Myxococcota bacterium]
MLVLLVSSTAWAGGAVLLFPAIGTPAAVTLAGRVLKHAPSSGTTTLSRNLRRLTSSNWEGAPVEVRYAGRSAQVTSGHDGNFSVTLAAGDKPFEPGLASAEANVRGAGTGAAMVTIVQETAPFFVVSDFDDTLAVTNVIQTKGLVKAALLQDEKDQPVVEGMAAFYGCLEADKVARPAFALVSGSPVQYVHRVRDFLTAHRFPPFGIYLRDLGPGTLSDYKQPVIRALLDGVPNAVVLVGDSGEHDPEVYAQLRAEYPTRVKAIYIRNAGRADDARRFEGMVLFSHPREAALDASTKGLATRECVLRAFPELETK